MTADARRIAAELIKDYEGFRDTPYRCPAGVWTIGYGETAGIHARSPVMPHEEAERRLLARLNELTVRISALCLAPMGVNQLAAVLCFTDNVGIGQLKRSTLLKRLNAYAYFDAACEFGKWRRGGGVVLPGLVTRRAREANLFCTPSC